MSNLKLPHGTTPAEQLEKNAADRAITTIRLQAKGEALGSSSRSASPATLTGAGTPAVGKLGFALGLSGFGGNDWLMPSKSPARAPYILLMELS